MSWHCDDAYHGYTMSRNLVEGNGLVYNIGERVNASTCPLFTLIIALFYSISGNIFLSGIFAGVLFSTLAFYFVIYKFCKTIPEIIISTCLLLCSASFVSYTTSGLENSLLFFLSTAYLFVFFNNEKYSKKQLFLLALLVGFVATTRIDAVIFFVIPSCWAFLYGRKDSLFGQSVWIAIAGLVPFIVWELFSIIYYGFPFPNTAYVKLQTGIPRSDYFVRGVSYFIATAVFDLIVVFLPILYTILTIKYKKLRKHLLLACSVMLYYIYIVWIGGDFMVGRFFTIPLLVSLCGLLSLRIVYQSKKKLILIICTLVSCIIFNSAISPLITSNYFLWGTKNATYILHSNGTADERNAYFNSGSFYKYITKILNHTSIAYSNIHIDSLLVLGKKSLVLNPQKDNSSENSYASGILVYNYNPKIYISDSFGLGDPLLSKLPAHYVPWWRVGHMWREIPVGYESTLETGINNIENQSLHQYYEFISLIVRDKNLLKKERLKTIILMNLGKYDYLIDEYQKSLNSSNH